MKKKLRGALFASMSFLLLAGFYPGFAVANTTSLAIATSVFGLLHLFVRPVLKTLSIPFNLVTLGFFSLLINVAILYLLNIFVPEFRIVEFDFQTFEVLGFQVSGATLSPFFSAALASLLLSTLSTFLFWLVS